MKILVVDDKPANLFIYEKILKPLNVDIITADCGSKALELTLMHNFALILLDVQMPGMDGYEVAQVLRSEKATKHIPIVFVTAIDRDERFEIKGYETGAVDFIFKPINEQILLGKVRVFMALYQAHQDLLHKKQELETSVIHAQNMAEVAEASNRAKSQFLANMTHELRTPMNSILGFSDVLLDDTLTAQQQKHVHTIRCAAEKLLTLINDVLDFSKIESGQLIIESIDFSLKNLLHTVKSLVKTQANSKGIDFKITIERNVPETLQSDPHRLQQCLINLVDNAIKFTEEGLVHMKISAPDDQAPKVLHIAVEDTGIGIPEDHRQNIFKSFTQADGSTTRQHGGTGLGLTITKQLVELLGGALSMTSEVEKGSTFTLTLPIQNHSTQHSLSSESNTPLDIDILNTNFVGERTRFTGKVLVAEDVEGSQQLMKLMLSKLGVDVCIAENGKQAIQMGQTASYDLILMDMHMPQIDGYEATRTLKEQGCLTPIVALTANAIAGDEQKCLEAGCDGYITKPINRRELPHLLAKYLAYTQELRDETTSTERIAPPYHSSTPEQGAESYKANGLLDWDKLIDMMGDEETVREILPTYIQDMQVHYQSLTDSIHQGQISGIITHAHALKGVGRNLSFERLQVIMKTIEHTARENNLEACTEHYHQSAAEIDEIITALRDYELITLKHTL